MVLGLLSQYRWNLTRTHRKHTDISYTLAQLSIKDGPLPQHVVYEGIGRSTALAPCQDRPLVGGTTQSYNWVSNRLLVSPVCKSLDSVAETPKACVFSYCVRFCRCAQGSYVSSLFGRSFFGINSLCRKTNTQPPLRSKMLFPPAQYTVSTNAMDPRTWNTDTASSTMPYSPAEPTAADERSHDQSVVVYPRCRFDHTPVANLDPMQHMHIQDERPEALASSHLCDDGRGCS